MADAYFVEIDLDRLRANLAAAEGQPITDDELHAWLAECGFEPAEGGWIAEEISVEALAKDEIGAIRAI